MLGGAEEVGFSGGEVWDRDVGVLLAGEDDGEACGAAGGAAGPVGGVGGDALEGGVSEEGAGDAFDVGFQPVLLVVAAVLGVGVVEDAGGEVLGVDLGEWFDLFGGELDVGVCCGGGHGGVLSGCVLWTVAGFRVDTKSSPGAPAGLGGMVWWGWQPGGAVPRTQPECRRRRVDTETVPPVPPPPAGQGVQVFSQFREPSAGSVAAPAGSHPLVGFPRRLFSSA